MSDETMKRKESTGGGSGLSYGVVAVLFLLIGVALGALGYDRLLQANQAENQTLIQDAVTAALAAQSDDLANSVVAALMENAQGGSPSEAPDPNVRFETTIDGEPYVGADDPIVTIVEFSDFQCGYCKRFHDDTFQAIVDNYGDQVKFVYRDFPILGDMSVVASLAASCADEQGQFWPYHDLLFENQGSFSQDRFIEFATQLELDVESFTTCLEDQTYFDAVQADYNEAISIGARGTPAFLINGRFISGAQPYDVFASMIDAEIAAANSASEEESAEG